MLIDLPTAGTFDALVLAGTLSDGSTEAEEMAVVLKAAYDLVDDGSGVRRFEPAADTSAADLVLADQGRYLYSDPDGTRVIPAGDFGVDTTADPPRAFLMLDGERVFVDDIVDDGDLDLVFDLQREADLALAKERTDVVVEGMAGVADAAVAIDEHLWLRRQSPAAPRFDVARNVFGWQGRDEQPRRDDAADDDTIALGNAYRRTPGFNTPSSLNTAPLPSAVAVEVFGNATGTGTATIAARLPDLRMGLRLRVYCGHGPDEPPRWRIVPRPDLVPDTLVLRPDSFTAEICWRGRWPADLEPTDAYRSVQIRAGGF